ncbi:MAG: ISAs1 family transposase [Anaerolineaceae bacterium]|nr:ISAs1 family transposase [Anaerolineaceae bacterium]
MDNRRIEIQECWTLLAERYLPHVRCLAEWDGARSLVLICSERRIWQQTTSQTRCLISNLAFHAAKLLEAVRSYWGIENSMNRVLDVAFDEDHNRIREDHAPQNFAVIRQIDVNFLKQEKTVKGGIQAKR